MLSVVKRWFNDIFSSTEVVSLFFSIVIGIGVFYFLSNTLMPLLVAIVLAYLLDGLSDRLCKCKIPRMASIVIVFLLFIVSCLIIIFALLPLLTKQITAFVGQLPSMLGQGQDLLAQLPKLYPEFFNDLQIAEISNSIRYAITSIGQDVLSYSVANVINIFAVLVYAFLIPMMIFFLLKDKKEIIVWAQNFMPYKPILAKKIFKEVDLKISSYIRGKFIEIMLVWLTSFILFISFGLKFSFLLSFLVGLSVIIPFVGVVLVTIPIIFIAYIQFGMVPLFGYLLLGHAIIQIVDGNVIVPILFSEVVNLHPLAIIVAVLFFGGIWGVWGIFFAIPLATLFHSIINSWQNAQQRETINPKNPL
ncbi:MAG: AI-2E family transporter [Gammaproteobacteria bacterium]|nr:MAG: AI-2E family transporter [Gammaproteobacteria bacterium]